MMEYCQTSNISRTFEGNGIVDYSDAVGASLVGAASTTSSFSTSHLDSMDWAKTTAKWYDKHLSFWIWCGLYYRFDCSTECRESPWCQLCRHWWDRWLFGGNLYSHKWRLSWHDGDSQCSVYPHNGFHLCLHECRGTLVLGLQCLLVGRHEGVVL